MDVAIVVDGRTLRNVEYVDGNIRADMPECLCLTPADMVGVDIDTLDNYRRGYLSIRLADSLYLQLVYPLPPTNECAACHTKVYSDALEYISEDVTIHYPSLLDYRWEHVCKSCIGLHIDEQETPIHNDTE